MIARGRAVKLEGGEEIAETDTAIVDAAAFVLVIEGTVEPVAHAIMEDVDMSTIGTGAPPAYAEDVWSGSFPSLERSSG